MIFNIQYCTGNNRTERKHIELIIITDIITFSDNYLYFNGNFENWFKYWIEMKTKTKLFNTTCWRQHNNSLLCSRILGSINSLVLNLSLIFVVKLSVGNDGTSLD